MTDGRTGGGGGGGGGVASGALVLVGIELGSGPVLGDAVGVGTVDVGADEGVALGWGVGGPTVVHSRAQKAVS